MNCLIFIHNDFPQRLKVYERMHFITDTNIDPFAIEIYLFISNFFIYTFCEK